MEDFDPVRWNPTITYVYFIVCGKYVKIGISSRPKSRLYSVQVDSPFKCKLESTIKLKGKHEALELEKEIHNKFSHLNKRGEWFKYNKEIKDYLK